MGAAVAFQEIVGQEQALRLLHKALSEARLAQAYLFHGPPGVGKKLTAFQFVKALYCFSATSNACNNCTACRKITAGNHPDVEMITPDDTSIKIEQVRALQRRLGYKPYENRHTAVIIDGCEFLTPPAANALLKILEEPPTQALLLLLTGNKAAVPLTIISRCQLVPFRPLTPADIQTILERQGVDRPTASLAATLAEGCLDRWSQTDFAQALDTRQSAYNILKNIVQAKSITPFIQARQLAGKREQCATLLHWLSLFCRDLTVLQVAPDMRLYNQDLRRELIPLTHRVPLDRLLETFELLQQLRLYLHMNLSPQLIFEQLLVQLHQALSIPPKAPRPNGSGISVAHAPDTAG
jgi:DNA polymerase-3 subunit delta'